MQQTKFVVTASWAISLVLLFACGGGSSNDGGKPSPAQVKDACVKLCQKLNTCEGGGFTIDCNDFCTNDMGPSSPIPPGCDTNATLSKIQACVDGACPALEDCLSNATSACSSGTGGSGSGTGGRTGTGGASSSTGGIGSSTGGIGSSTGGRSGTGGASSSTGGTTSVGGAGSGDCSVCTKAGTCCVALFTEMNQDTASCAQINAATCTQAGASQSAVITACQNMLATGVALNIAACM